MTREVLDTDRMGTSETKVTLEQVKALIAQAVEKETAVLKTDILALKSENAKLCDKITKLEWSLDEAEQYNRKTSLILGGEGVPEGKHGESPAETRETAIKLIKEKLNVTLKGATSACHRLRNKKRIIIKFQDLDDRDAVYQAKFNQKGEMKDRITVHENLTDKRARMVKFLGDLRAKQQVLNYHTKNGIILARDSPDKRYSRIQPWFTEQEILDAMKDAPPKSEQAGNSRGDRFLKSQTLEKIPRDFVVKRTADLQEIAEAGQSNGPQLRRTRGTK